MVSKGLIALKQSITKSVEKARLKLDEKEIKPNMTLEELLSMYTLDNLIYIAKNHGVKYARKRKKELIKELSEVIQENICSIIKEKLDKEQQQLIIEIINSNGITDLSCLETKYGTTKEDSPFWRDQPPKSIIGRTRGLGIIFIGILNKKKIIMIPQELLQKIKQCPTNHNP